MTRRLSRLYVHFLVCVSFVFRLISINAQAEISIDQFLWLSDLHLDPFYGSQDADGGPGANCFHDSAPPYGQRGCDAPFRLIDETLQRAALSNMSFVILTGDLCRHGTDRLVDPMTTTQAILTNVSHLLRQYMPNVSIIPSMGNNDVTPDYYLDIENPTELLTMAAKGLDVLLESDAERATFLKGGFFARNVSAALTLLSFNTLLYSSNHIPRVDPEEDPLGQFGWLENQLIMADQTKRNVYIVGHIPPAMGSYRHSQLWQEPYLRKYYSMVQNYSSVIRGQFFGHLHADEFRWIPTLDSTHLPLWIASSVTPIYGSNPSYRLVSYDSSTSDPLDYDTIYLDLAGRTNEQTIEWYQGPSFRDSFQVKDLSPASVESLVHALNESLMEPDAPLWHSLLHRQYVYIEESAIPQCQNLSCRRAWMCTLTTTTADEYATCLATAGANGAQVAWARLSLQRRIMIAAILVGLGMIIILSCLCRFCSRYFRRRHYEQHISIDDTYLGEARKDSSLTTARSSSMDVSYHRDNIDDDVHQQFPVELPSIT